MDKQSYFLQQELLDEVPRFWLSRRWRLAVLGCFGFLIITSNRIGVEVALLCMLNRTSSNVRTTHPLNARFPDQIGIVNPALRFYDFHGKSVVELGTVIASNDSGTDSTDDKDNLENTGTSSNVEFPSLLSNLRKSRSVPTPGKDRNKALNFIRSSNRLRINATNKTILSPPTSASLSAKTTRRSFWMPPREPLTRSSTTKTSDTSTKAKLTTTTTTKLISQSTDYGVLIDDNLDNNTSDKSNNESANISTVEGEASMEITKCKFWNATTHPFLDMDLLSLPQTGDLDWTREEHTAIWEAYYLGDLIVRIPSAFLAQRFGGKHPFALAVLVESLCTALVPLASKLHYFPVLLLRLFTGMSAGISTPAMYYMLGRWAPPDERCLLLAIINTGGWISGCAAVLPLSCLLCTYGFSGGWSSVFYVFGGLGMLWCVLWMLFTNDTPEQDSSIGQDERDYIHVSIKVSENVKKFEDYLSNQAAWIPPIPTPATALIVDNNDDNDDNKINNDTKTPTTTYLKWPVVVTSVQLLTLACTEFTHEWIIMSFFCILPVYNNIILSYAIDEYSVAFIIPCAGFWFAMMMAAGAADRLLSYGVLPVTHIRKIMNSVGSTVASCMLVSVIFIGCNQRQGLLYISLIGLSFAGLQCSGAFMAPLDLSSKYAALLVGISGISRASVRFVIPPFAALLLRYNHLTDHVDDLSGQLTGDKMEAESSLAIGVYNRKQWYSLFVVTACCHLATALLYLLTGTGQHQTNWLESVKESTKPQNDQLNLDSPVDTDAEKTEFSVTNNDDNGFAFTPLPISKTSSTLAPTQSSANIAPAPANDRIDAGHTRIEMPSRAAVSTDDQLSENSFVSTNTSFDEESVCNKRPSQRNDPMTKSSRNRSLIDSSAVATTARVETNSINSSLSSTPVSVVNLRLKSLRDHAVESASGKRPSFAIESSSDNRNDEEYYDDERLASQEDEEEYEDEDSGSSIRRLSRHLRNSIVVDSDLSESVV